MRRGTTPTVVLTVRNEDGSVCDLTGQEIYVTFKEDGNWGDGFELTKSGEDLNVTLEDTVTKIEVTLTQTETLSFHEGRTARVQIRCKDANEVAQATDIASFKVEELLKEGKI